MERGKERRRNPRIRDGRVSMKVRSGQFDLITHALNISASGVYCKVDKELPLMSRVKLSLLIPPASSKKKEDTKTVEVEGVVVREHPVIVNGKIEHYDAAIFFEEFPARHKDAIAQYVSRKINLNPGE
ncbi:MAG: PilZ domain-containing protein [Candidatus Omnitrophota bacterium]